MIKKICIYTVLLFGITNVSAKWDAHDEYLRYRAYYKCLFFKFRAGEVVLSTNQANYQEEFCWHFKATGKSTRFFDALYKVRDTLESYMAKEEMAPLYFRRIVNHGHRRSTNEFRLDQQNKIIQCSMSYNGETFIGKLPLSEGSHDLLSMLNKFRQVDFSQYRPLERISYQMIIDNTIENLYFRYLGQEIVKIKNIGPVNCRVISVVVVKQDFFRTGESLKIWFSDDENQFPIQAEIKVKCGKLTFALLKTN